MRLKHQPRTKSATIPPFDDEGMRLLEVWVDLTHRVTAADAHGTERDATSLREQQVDVEHEIRRRLPFGERLLAELWVWEATLLHTDENARPEVCLFCRRASRGLPDDLPIPLKGVRR